jgi:ATPase subunit of ABC transporter with duplicated ATPase domains
MASASRRCRGALEEIHDRLGLLRFRGGAAEAIAATLSGGEMAHAALASVLLARPAPQLLVLEELTNNLDVASEARSLEGHGRAHGANV